MDRGSQRHGWLASWPARLTKKKAARIHSAGPPGGHMFWKIWPAGWPANHVFCLPRPFGGILLVLLYYWMYLSMMGGMCCRLLHKPGWQQTPIYQILEINWFVNHFPQNQSRTGFGWSHWINMISGIILGGVLLLVQCLKLRFVECHQKLTRTTVSRWPCRGLFFVFEPVPFPKSKYTCVYIYIYIYIYILRILE